VSRESVGLALVVIGVVLIVVASLLAYLQLGTISVNESTTLEDVLHVLALVMFKVSFIAVIAWSGAILVSRGLQAMRGSS